MFRKLNWEGKRININGDFLIHLRFADDIVLLTCNAQEVEQMLNQLNNESNKVGLRLIRRKHRLCSTTMLRFRTSKSIRISSQKLGT